MVIEYIILVIFVCSFGGALFILAKKIPAINTLPKNGTVGLRKHRIISDIEQKISDVSIYFEKQIFLHKFLSWVKIITLKTEVKVDNLLHSIRKKAQQVDKNLEDKK